MRAPRNNLTGQRFGRWLVIRQQGRRAGGKLCWLCRCDCGNEAEVTASNLRQGISQSCGCLEAEIHRRQGEVFRQRTQDRARRARSLRDQGWTLAEIGQHLGLTAQRIWQILRDS